jgi:excisionase family DNA binding protein
VLRVFSTENGVGRLFWPWADKAVMATMLTGRSHPTLDDVDDDAPTREFMRPARRAARPATPEGDDLWDANDVARYLKVSRSWVYHRAEAGQLPHLRVGGLLRFDADVVRAFARRK